MWANLRRLAWPAALLYIGTEAALLSTRPSNPASDFPMPPLWFYLAYGLLPTISGIFPFLVARRSGLIRFALFLVSLFFYACAWLRQFDVAMLILPHTRQWAAALTNFLVFSDRPWRYSLLVALVCLGMAASMVRPRDGYLATEASRWPTQPPR